MYQWVISKHDWKCESMLLVCWFNKHQSSTFGNMRTMSTYMTQVKCMQEHSFCTPCIWDKVVTVVQLCLNWERGAPFVNYTLSAWSNLLRQDKSQWPDGKSGCTGCPEWSMCPTKFTTPCWYMMFRSEKVSVMLFLIPRLHMLRWISPVLKHENILKAEVQCQAKQEYLKNS